MRIGIDLGGTKTEIICIEENGKEIYRQRVPSPKNDYPKTVENITRLVEIAESTLGRTGSVGVGIPGTLNKGGLVKNANSVWLNGQPLGKDLEKSLKREIRVQNDANCFAVSEAVNGAAEGAKSVFGVIIGTGCGAGLVLDGNPIQGVNGIAGEWGHNPLPLPRVYSASDKSSDVFLDQDSDHDDIINPIYAHKDRPSYYTDDVAWSEYPGPACYCSKRGCLETWISGTGFKNDYIRVTGIEKSTHDIIKDVERGDPDAMAAFGRYADRLARALAHVINVYDPDVIVLGGGMSNVSQLYSVVPSIWEKYIFSDSVDTELKPPKYGDSSGVRGAAWLWNK